MKGTRPVVLLAALLACAWTLGAEPANPQAAAFEQLFAKVLGDPAGASEAQVKQLLTQARQQGRCYAVSLAVKGHLAHNFRASPSLLRLAADNALLAGDFRTAAARYKAYLASAPNGAEASEAAGALYLVLTDFLGADDDAYQFIRAHGQKFRSAAASRKFDAWFLEQARRRRDCAGMAKALRLVLAQKLPLEQERLYFWQYLDWLMDEVGRGRPEYFEALPHCRRILPLVRGSRPRSLRYAPRVANLAFHAGSAGKDPEALDRAYETVVAAAKTYFDAYPTADTLKDVVSVFSNGGAPGHFDGGAWSRQAWPKRRFVVYAFGKLNDKERQAFLSWHTTPQLAAPEHWAELGARHADLFRRTPAVRRLRFVTQPAKRDLYKTQAAFLRDVPSRDAAAISAMAASDDLSKCVDELMRKQSWHLEPSDPYHLLHNVMWPAHRALGEKAGKKPSDDEYRKALVRFGSEHLAKSPAALDAGGARAFIEAAWDLGTKGDRDDKSAMIGHLASLQWVPWQQRERRDVFSQAHNRFRGWASQVRRDRRSKTPKLKPELARQIAPLEDAFKRALDPRAADPAKAPNPLCRALASAVLAERSRNQGEFLKQARALYPLVRDYDAKKTPFGRPVLRFILQNRLNAFDTIDFQCEALKDQLAQFDPARPSARIEEACNAAIVVGRDKGWWRTPKQARDRTLRLNALFEKALLDRLAKGQFSPKLFDWFRGSRRGEQWEDKQRGEAVLATIIDRKAFHKTDYRPDPGTRSATCSYMRLIRDEFPGLKAKYPIERHFDDLFVEEATRTKFLDWRYWDYGLDAQKKIVNAAARILQGHKTLPYAYNDSKVVYTGSDFWNWQARALGAEKPARDAMVAAVEAAYGKTRFDTYAMGRAYFNTAADVSKPKGRKEFFTHLSNYLARVRSAPVRLSPPYLGPIANLGDPAKLSDGELKALLSIFPSCAPARWPDRWHFDTLARTLTQALLARERETDLYPLIPHFWKIARDTHSGDLQRDLARLALDLGGRESHDLALVCSATGLAMMKARLPEDARGSLIAVRSKSMSNIGGVIPVKRDDRRYPIFAAQAAYMGGRLQSAWELYLPRRRQLVGMVKELDPTFCIWLLDKHTEVREFEAAEALARKMIQWFDSVADGFQPQVRARLLLSYANIALVRKEYPRARALFERIAAAEEFKGIRAQGQAQLKVAEVDRFTGRFDEAAKQLEKLARSKDAYLQAESYYGLALVRFDQEEYREALDYVDQVLARAPDHAYAKILEARARVKLRKLEEPTEIQIGTVTRKRFIIPGKPLRVGLEDRNLAIVGKSTHIEIRAWTKSGDEELFTLTPFGDSKTKFRGGLATELAPVTKGDRTLQVLGDDVVRYDFSERFKKEHKITAAAPQTLRVTTDAVLLVSSGRILTKEEREAQALDQLIRRRLGADDEAKEVALSTVRRENQIKPGNKLNVRVLDPDRSGTAGKDKLAVRLSTSSGDAIAAFHLEETGSHTGVFEGAVQTASGQAVAFASDSDDGREPNCVISKGDYPAWVALPDNQRPKTFSVDLNDNVALGTMTVQANVPGRKLKSFRLDTSLNGREFTTVGTWPKPFEPWDGSPVMELVRYGKNNRAASDLATFTKYLAEGHLTDGVAKFTRKTATMSASLDNNVAGLAGKMGLAGEREGSWYIIHHRAAFYQPARRIRAFEIEAKGLVKEPRGARGQTRYLLTIDGKPGDLPHHVRRSLGKGVHRVDIYVGVTRKAQPQYELRCDTNEPPFMMACPPDLFSPAKHPQIRAGVYVEPAKIAASDDGGKFDVAFAAASRARIIRFLITDFETDAPAINKITLVDGAGATVLPTKEPFTALRKNQVLEIVPGDRVTIVYEDPRVVTQGREHHEAFLTATFSNATLSACFVEYSVDGAGERKARYIPMRRFKPGDKINVFINDPDCDTSDKQDTIAFTARTSEGKPARFPAVETEEHSGVFVGGVFPVETQPKRKSELKVVEGDDVIVAYVDKENTDPGIPWDRTCVCEQTWYEPPEVRVYSVASQPLPDDEREAKAPAGPRRRSPRPGDEPLTEEVVPLTHSMVVTWPERPEAQKPTPALIHGPLLVEVVFPYIAQSPESTATLYVQTASGRKAYGKQPEGPFDIKVPGTLKLQVRPSNVGNVAAPPGYKSVIVRGNPYAANALDDGRFTFSVPMELGKLPATSLAIEEPEDKGEKPSLSIKGDDEILVGMQFTDDQGKASWVTRRVVLDADSFFDAMDRRYREGVTGLYVGETAYFRVIDPVRDTSDDKDAVTVAFKTTGGTTRELKLTETFMHSGIFKGHAKIVFQGDKAEAEAADVVPVQYGDTIAATYARPGAKEEERLVRDLIIHKGSDGLVLPFTKRFKDPAIAVQTQFTVAEAYFEMAKRHRALGNDGLARREIAQGKKLLEEAIRDYPDTEARAQADYLLAELSLEFGNDAKNAEIKKKFYLEAVSRFTDIVATHPDSPYAPKAQYKKALVFEKMGQIDEACEEYVKLSYRYPDNELVAETIARLGQYFLTKGKGIRKQGEELDDAVEREKLEIQAKDMYKTAAQVFGRLAVRFPSHRLSGRTAVLSAQCYMQAVELPKAVAVFKTIVANTKMDKDLVAESMYWCGDCHMKLDDYVNAYRMFKKLTWDYPASKWAKFARGRLTEEVLENVATKEEE